jgi:hypothetical protein
MIKASYASFKLSGFVCFLAGDLGTESPPFRPTSIIASSTKLSFKGSCNTLKSSSLNLVKSNSALPKIPCSLSDTTVRRDYKVNLRAYHFGLGGFAGLVNLHRCVYLELLINDSSGHMLIEFLLLGLSFLIATGPDDSDGQSLACLVGDRLDMQSYLEVFCVAFLFHNNY